MQRPATDVERVIDDRNIILQEVAEDGPGDTADQHDRRHPSAAELERVVQLFDGKRRVGIQPGVTRTAGRARRGH